MRGVGRSVSWHDDLSGQRIDIYLSHAQHVDPVMSVEHGSVRARFQTVLLTDRERTLQGVCIETLKDGKLGRAEEFDTVQRGEGWLIAAHATAMLSA